jgi:hypothetical protein
MQIEVMELKRKPNKGNLAFCEVSEGKI